jgi:glucokinase
MSNKICPACVLGVDVGGTKIRYGLVSTEGKILAWEEYESHSLPADAWIKTLFSQIDPFWARYRSVVTPIAAGMGIRGSVDHLRQRLRSSSVILDAGSCDICRMVSERYGIPAFIENDVKAATLYELMFGVGQREKTFACVNVGTGLSMGLVLDGKLVHGMNNNAGEIGNMLFQRCDNGEIVSIESVASGQGMELERSRLENSSDSSRIPRGGRSLAAACKSGDPFAKKIIDTLILQLALLLLNLEAGFDIGTYILAGGVMSDPWMRERLCAEITTLSAQAQKGVFKWNARIAVSELGAGNVGLCGSACVALYKLRNVT